MELDARPGAPLGLCFKGRACNMFRKGWYVREPALTVRFVFRAARWAPLETRVLLLGERRLQYVHFHMY